MKGEFYLFQIELRPFVGPHKMYFCVFSSPEKQNQAKKHKSITSILMSFLGTELN